jgi:HAD superfamily hydrolase (TIGR01509 family)
MVPSMIDTILFDLDGVLVEAKLIHYEALNQALAEIDPAYVISWSDHLSIYDGLKTSQKLELLTKNVGLSPTLYKRVWQRKQEITLSLVASLPADPNLISLFQRLKSEGYIIGCCSNSIRRSVLTMLSRIGIIEYMDIVLSNEDVRNSKPHPEIYWHAMSLLGKSPDQVLVVEDSPPGLLAASYTGAEILRVVSPKDLTYSTLMSKLQHTYIPHHPRWENRHMNIVIPMAGAGSRFQKAGYTFPKPLIDVNGMPMIQRVVANLNIDAHYIFLVQKEHRQLYHLDTMFKLFVPNFTVVEVDGLTEGAACTVLLAKDLINNDAPLLMANADQLIEWNSTEFMYKMQEHPVDGSIITFTSTHPMFSFAKTDEHGTVTEVAEKNPISNQATVGLYYWTKGSDFVKYAEQMIAKNERVNNEFYVCPVYNEAIGDGKTIKVYPIERMWSLGTPDQLDYYLSHGTDRV